MFDCYRHIYSTAFERTPNGFIYYEKHWSKGIPVSTAERELYLSGATDEWYDANLGREAVVPRRPYWRSVKRMLVAAFFDVDPAEPNGR